MQKSVTQNYTWLCSLYSLFCWEIPCSSYNLENDALCPLLSIILKLLGLLIPILQMSRIIESSSGNDELVAMYFEVLRLFEVNFTPS